MLALSESPAPTRYALTDALSLTSNYSTQPSPPLNPSACAQRATDRRRSLPYNSVPTTPIPLPPRRRQLVVPKIA